MEAVFHCQIQTPDALVYDGPVTLMQIATDDGVIEIHPNHSNLMTTVSASRIKVITEDAITQYIVARHGVIEFDTTTNRCNGLFFSAELTTSFKKESLLEYKERILKDLEQPQKLSRYHIDFLQNESMSIEKLLVIQEENQTTTITD